jgi:alpha-L-rhamnosidase
MLLGLFFRRSHFVCFEDNLLTSKTSLCCVFCASLLCLTAASAFAAPVHLRVNGRVNPLGIDTAKPVFSWQSDATARDWKQSAYEVLVARSVDALRAGRADVWDSGKQMSSESVDIAYGGPALKSQQRCFWMVRVWDAAGAPSMAMEPASFEMGLLQPADWKAQWVRRDDPRELEALQKMQWIWLANANALQAPQGSAAEFRYVLHLAKKPEAADLHVLCGETCTTTVNGVVTGHKKEWAAFDQEEIRDALKFGQGVAGDNVVLIRFEVPKSEEAGKTFPASLAAALRLRKQDGDETWLLSGDGWEGRNAGANAAWTPVAKLGTLTSKLFDSGSNRRAPIHAPERIVSGASLYRKVFESHGSLVSARLYITALGSYRAFVNGKQVGNDALTPGFTDFRKRVLYQTYDVTSMVTAGKNAIGTMLGAGWHGSPLLWSGVRRFSGPDCLRAQLELTYADGSHRTVATDSSWGASDAPVVAAEIYGGETYDARLEQTGWDTAKFRESKRWTPAVVSPVDAAVAVTAEPDLPVQPRQTIAPVSVKMVGEAQKVAVFDMGQNMVGLVRLHVHGPRGATVRLRFAERLNPDGTIYTENLRDADATDRYTLAGKGDEAWMPAFTFHGFRYVEVAGYPGTPALADIQGQVLNSLPEKPAMRLETSSDLLNRMSELGLWGQRGNFVSIPTDCPQRDERMGWMGDAGAFWRTGSYNFDIDSFSDKFMQDIVDAQAVDGAFADISPNLLVGTQGTPGAPGWSDAGILVPYATWLQYGNRSLLEQNWPAMQRFMNFIERTNPTFLRKNALGANYADWLAPDPHTPRDLVGTAYWALVAQQMQTMAVALGRDEDAKKYAALYDHIRAAYQAQYVHADGSVEGDTQTVYVVTLAMGLAPKALEANMTDRLVKNIADHQNHLTTGFLGTPYLLPALDKEGRADVAYSLLLNDTYPSWGYMVAKGATTWWERWNGDTGDPGMNSYNHYAFGSVMAWVYRRTAGIDADTRAAGFHHVEIAPQVNSKLSHVHAEYDSVYGTIVTDWKTDANHTLHLMVSVPANTTATVHLPGAATMDGKQVATSGQGASTAEIGSGTYQFEVAAPQP